MIIPDFFGFPDFFGCMSRFAVDGVEQINTDPWSREEDQALVDAYRYETLYLFVTLEFMYMFGRSERAEAVVELCV